MNNVLSLLNGIGRINLNILNNFDLKILKFINSIFVNSIKVVNDIIIVLDKVEVKFLKVEEIFIIFLKFLGNV